VTDVRRRLGVHRRGKRGLNDSNGLPELVRRIIAIASTEDEERQKKQGQTGYAI
jgi:hypothetical protein